MQVSVNQEFTSLLNILFDELNFKLPAISKATGIDYERLKNIRRDRTKANTKDLERLKIAFGDTLKKANLVKNAKQVESKLSDKDQIINLLNEKIDRLEKSEKELQDEVSRLREILKLAKEEMEIEQDPQERKIQKELIEQIAEEIKTIKEDVNQIKREREQ